MVSFLAALNPQQQTAVEETGHCCLVSCPGSGKTRTIIAKLLSCVEDVRGTPRRVGCITYTNSAVYEIERRLREEGAFDEERYCVVGTIHAFCLRNVMRPFGHILDGGLAERKILPPDSELFRTIVTSVVSRHGLESKAEEVFQNIGFRIDGSLLLPHRVTEGAAREFFDAVAREGFLTFSELLYFSFQLVAAESYVAQALASRYAWLLVDEFQDTTELQVEILSRIIEVDRTKLFYVGDPNQSIYGFTGARPDLMANLAGKISARSDVTLNGNYRSSRQIVQCAEMLLPTSPSMKAIGENADFPAEPLHFHEASPFEGITRHFLPALSAAGIDLGKASVLASSWYPLFPLGRSLRDASVPIFGPGARPYRRATAFARFAEEVCAYIETEDPKLAVYVQRAFSVMLLELIGWVPNEAEGIVGKEILVGLLHDLAGLREAEQLALSWLVRAASVTSCALASRGVVNSEQAALIVEAGDAMVDQIQRSLGSKASSFEVSEMGLFARAPDCLRLQTIHAAKGHEFDAVAVVDLHDGKLPHFSAETPEQLEEEKRKLYVACTRARKILMFFTDSSNWRNGPSPFLRDLGLL